MNGRNSIHNHVLIMVPKPVWFWWFLQYAVENPRVAGQSRLAGLPQWFGGRIPWFLTHLFLTTDVFSLFFPPVTIVGGIPSFPVRTSWFLISEHWSNNPITRREPTGRFRTRQSLLTLGANSPTATSPKKTRGLRVCPAVDLAQKDGQTMKDCPSRLAVDVESVSLLGAGYWSWHRSSDASNYASSVPRCNLFVMESSN